MPEDNSPDVKWRKPLPKARVLTPSPPDAYPIRIKKAKVSSQASSPSPVEPKVSSESSSPSVVDDSPVSHFHAARRQAKRILFLTSRFGNLQAKEVDKAGQEVDGSSNSDDDNESDMSYVSQGLNHSNAERHVYLNAQSSQGGFPTPMHEVRFSGTMSLAGTCAPLLSDYVTYIVTYTRCDISCDILFL